MQISSKDSTVITQKLQSSLSLGWEMNNKYRIPNHVALTWGTWDIFPSIKRRFMLVIAHTLTKLFEQGRLNRGKRSKSVHLELLPGSPVKPGWPLVLFQLAFGLILPACTGVSCVPSISPSVREDQFCGAHTAGPLITAWDPLDVRVLPQTRLTDTGLHDPVS